MDTSMPLLQASPTPLHEVTGEVRLQDRGVRLWIKRDDLIHPTIPGNKFRKLKYNLEAAGREGHDTLLTFGGAFSNHIYATAQAGQLCGFRTIGVIRGEEHLPLNPVLEAARSAGMEIVYLDRESYRRKHDSETVESLKRRYGSFYLIPEGGSNALAVRGAREIVGEIDLDFDCIVTAVGTGGTLAGLIVGLGEGNRGAEAVGVAVLKGASFLKDDVAHLLSDVGPSSVRWRIELDYHFGGFARVRPELVEFMSEFEDKHGIVLDPIYTGKMAYGLLDLVEAGRFPPGTRIVALHTGGVPRTHWAGLVPEKD